ncbi:TetR/AcrR family transcriptional regulator [Methylovorus menthalis]|uniref:TetR/AcrR family transcriptional regulator n=1 Tax=Methylovorus menthalis TaxID=1002227 RepID=UPI001E3F20C0|nr:TetR/AcrR family transcriptional regulator [Methylovorus menthalis]MCB4811785.1 TetR/AcrR family transcriptional regulator [Methylovorus menthalis]
MKKTTTPRNTINRKETTHKRIVETAARAIRRSGYDGTGVADIMKEAGLTHGGFYAHFSSRDAMLAEAADLAGADTIAIAERIFAEAPREQALFALMNAYLSNEHMANIESGCALASLGSEMPRQAPEVRKAATRRIKEMVALVESRFTGQPNAHQKALVTISTMVGTLLLARAVDEPELSQEFRQAALKHHKAIE